MTRTRIICTFLALILAAPCFASKPGTTGYPFPLPPDQALATVGKLEKIAGTKLAVTAGEKKLFAEARGGKLDTWSFGDACLVASGVTDSAKRKEYVAKLDRIEADARKAVEGAKSPAETGEQLLKFLHAGPMKGGYRSQQTDLHTILDDGTFNCVSSAALYNVIGRRLGLDLRAVEIPGHVYSVLKDGDRLIVVETTNPKGFNPKDGKSKGSTASKRREVGELGLASIIAYNHGVALAGEKKHHEALLANFRALSLDLANPSAATNALASFVDWSTALANAGKYEEAFEVLATGLSVAPKDPVMLNNRKVYWHEYAEARMKAGKTDEALDVLRRAAKALPGQDFESHQAVLFIRPAQELTDAGKWEEALAVYATGLGKVDAKAKAKLKDARVGLFLDWSRERTDKGEFEKALEILAKGAKLEPKDSHVRNNVLATYDAWANTFMKKGEWSKAISVYEKALGELPGDRHLKHNLDYCKQQLK